MTNAKSEAPDSWGCTLKQVDDPLRAAQNAAEHNEANLPDSHIAAAVAQATGVPKHESIAMLTSKYWGVDGVDLTVGFLDNPPRDLRAKILEHMNAWSKTANVAFREEAEAFRDTAHVRIARARDGHWSYLGTDVKLIDKGRPTMNLQEFTLKTPESEFFRVVRHETGHTLGCPHEHLRKELVDLIDEKKAIEYFGRTQGWDADMVRRQVLTPIDAASIKASVEDQQSIMCYQIPGSITKTGKPISGGLDIDKTDYDFIALMYPKSASSSVAAAPAAAVAPGEGAPSRSGAPHAGVEARHGWPSAIELVRGDLRVRLREPLERAAMRELLEALG